MTDGNLSAGSQNGLNARTPLSENELDALFALANAPPASDALKRRILDDHRVIAESIVAERPRLRITAFAKWTEVRTALGARWADVVRIAAPAGAFAALSALGFFVGANQGVRVDDAAYIYVASAFSEIADEVEEGLLWAE